MRKRMRWLYMQNEIELCSGMSSRVSTHVMNLICILFACMAGLIVGIGNYVTIFILLAGIVCVGLLFKPVSLIYVISSLGLLVVGVTPLWADGGAAKSAWAVSLLGLVLMLLSLAKLSLDKEVARGTPPFVWILLVFVVYAALHSIIQWSSASEIFSGFKRYFQVTGLVFAMAWLAIDSITVSRWRILIVAVAFLQLPWALYQLIEWVPVREGVRYFYPGMIPIDVVAGTFGSSKFSGGANAEMATFLVVVLAFFLSRLRERLISVKRFVLFLPALAPLFLGETKVVVVLLPLMFIALYRSELFRRPMFALGALIVGAALTASVTYAYLNLLGKTLEEQINDTVEYNFQERGYGANLLNRTTALTFWVNSQGSDDPIGGVFGHGLGAAHSATGGYIARPLAGYGIDLTAASTLLWEQGPVGLALFIAILIAAWREAGRLARAACSSKARADAAAIQAVIPIFAFYLVYRVAYLESMPFQIVFYGVLGYLAWLSKAANDACDDSK